MVDSEYYHGDFVLLCCFMVFTCFGPSMTSTGYHTKRTWQRKQFYTERVLNWVELCEFAIAGKYCKYVRSVYEITIPLHGIQIYWRAMS